MTPLDALVDPTYTRLWTLTPQAYLWVETHVTVQQVQTWSEGVLEVAAYDMTDLIVGMLRAGLRLTPVGERLITNHTHLHQEVGMVHASTN